MSLLAVGVSHRTAEVRLLEKLAVSSDGMPKLLDELLGQENVTEALLLSTCNRIEVYAVVDAFHGGLADVTSVLSRHSGIEVNELCEHFYVHYAAAAVEHLFSVAAGLDSMVLGEAQILGQLRGAYADADEAGTVGKTLHEVAQQALRVGKRVHAETGIDHAGASVVSEALADADRVLDGLAGRRALLVGAGSMGGLAAAHLRRAGIGEIVIANRTPANGDRLAAALTTEGVPARSVGLDRLDDEISATDVLLACTGAMDVVVDVDRFRPDTRRGPLVVCDLGLPRDVDPAVGDLDGVTLVDLETLQHRLAATPSALDTERARRIVADGVRDYLAGQRSAAVTPTVTALRRRAAEVVDAELLRLDSRLPDLDDSIRAELARTVRRVVDKLLHTPTVRVKELASSPGGAGYADALRELFELDPHAPRVVSSPRTVETEHGGGDR
jgi:glutamyl-tRNA reductase